MYSEIQIADFKERLDKAENNAREIKQWLTDHPGADIEAIREQRRLLKDELQNINDLVLKIKAPLPYNLLNKKNETKN